MSLLRPTSALLILLGALVIPGLCAAADPAPIAGAHGEELVCEDCHPGTGDATSFTGKILDCDHCHDANNNIHPIGLVVQEELPEGFALGPNREMLCRSCHKIHGGDPDAGYLTDAGAGYEKGRAAFCANCHGSENVRTNPHSARQGDSRCIFCHTKPPAHGEDPAPTLRARIVTLCDFCHGQVQKNHPRNIDPTLSIPEELPLDKDGNWTCVTCHNPHGTVTTTHYVHPLFARHMERGKQESPHKPDYFACNGCHTESTEHSIRVPGYSLRYRGDINILCISCHVTDRGHHPTGLALPDAMAARREASPLKMPLDGEERIDCYTCHDNQCDTTEHTMTLRHYDAATYRTDLCWICHDREEYATTTPHVNNPKACLRCHETRPVPGLSRGLMTVPVMVCLHCHDVNPHPMGKPHVAMPSEAIQVDPSLPVSKEGKVTCVTCHEPHYTEQGIPFRLRAEPAQICNLCHWKG